MIKIGDKVVCINPFGNDGILELYKCYTVIDILKL